MAVGHLQRGQLATSARRTAQVTRVPAPILGIDSRAALSKGDPDTCIYTYNLQPYEYGMRVRKGYREWQVDIETAPDMGLGVRTVIPFDGVERSNVGDRLFAVTNEGIWDVTVFGGTPVLKVAFAIATSVAGYGTYSHYTGDNENDVLFFADSANGLFEYDADTDTWAQATGITGPAITNISFVVLHKQRLWMFEENSTSAWYLGVGSQSGQATEFFFGSKFRHGGHLAGLFNWSVDGGAGLDDYLIAISNAGDVLAYAGDDPSLDDWSLRGSYFIGQIPRGVNFAAEHAGELLILSSLGLINMNQLLQGSDSVDTMAGQTNTAAGKISMNIRDAIRPTLDIDGWTIRTAPSEAALIITRPKIASKPHRQFYFNYVIGGWGIWHDVPMTTYDSWRGNIAFGTADNRMCYMDVNVDNLQLDPPDPLHNGDDINFSILSSFQSYELDGVYKKVKLIRPDFVTTSPVSSSSVARYDYDISEALHGLPTASGEKATWDDGIWDKAIWAGGLPEGQSVIKGSWGYGRYVAIATKGKTRGDTRLVGWDVIFSSGGPLV